MKNALEYPLALVGTGFLRAAILRRIGECHPGTLVRVLGPTPPEPVEGVQVEYVAGRSTDTEALNTALDGAHAVVHLGSESGATRRGHGSATPYAANVSGTAAISSAAISRGCRHLLFCSTPEVYGEGAGRLLDETDPVVPQTRLARAKIIGERLTAQFGLLPGRTGTVVRPFGLYGPGQPGESTMGRVLKAAMTGHPISLPGGGMQLRNFTYSDDVAEGILAALCRANAEESPFACYNIASCETFSLRDAARLAVGLAGSASAIESPAHRAGGRRAKLPVTVQIPSVERAASELGFRAATLLSEGLSRCILHDHTTTLVPVTA
ncbi:NAD-dependent epimerase [Microtetraspora sp. NBRC 13810]|uniref:NAD-dependent epimerase/dehydratase family protein n=1 Tax=Microtetraspora sp. NBRC 13810 TaxID=3030990 RepID=UPI0024A4A6D0|nr:NAD(P)-dependent oxidoreductase [Microtetraspora sp. NBRC 13810]GLW09876.1 NAD-dependent epimerase [Microtetraspora sp. NBRC 13810]